MSALKNLQLGISAFVVLLGGLVYGINPDNILLQILGFEVNDLELKNIFKAIMGLYWAFGIFWILGIVKPAYWKMATITSILFIGGLAFGRCVSLVVDGISIPWVVGTVLELFMMFWGIVNLISSKKALSSS